jgi:NADPH2:quinone reductase
MKALVMTAPGNPDVLEVQELPIPTIQGRQLLVRLKAAGINPLDTKLRSRGTYFPERMPAILGCDGAGIVEAVGPDVSDFKVGDAVYFCNGGIGGHPGTYAEYATIDERFTAPKPSALSFTEAAAAPLVTITAWEALHERGRLQPEQRALIHAGAGGVGHIAVQLARLHGAQVCTTVSGGDKTRFVADLGVDNIVDYRDGDFVEAVNDWSNGGVELAFDTVGGETFHRSVHCVRHYGDLITLLQPGADMDWKEARLRNLRVSFELMLSPMVYRLSTARQRQADILRRCAELFDNGKLRIHLANTFPLEQAAEAHRAIEAGGMLGKLALVMDER